MPQYIIFLVLTLAPDGSPPKWTGEKFANPIDCQMRVNEIMEKQKGQKHKLLHFCKEFRSSIDLSKSLEKRK